METSFAGSETARNTHKLRILTGNVRSMRNKFDELKNILLENSIDIIALTETWLTPDVADPEISLLGYEMFRSDRTGNNA